MESKDPMPATFASGLNGIFLGGLPLISVAQEILAPFAVRSSFPCLCVSVVNHALQLMPLLPATSHQPTHPSIVDTSPTSFPVSFAFKNRRRIFPLRVFGNADTNSNAEGVAIGPNSRRTCSINVADKASDGT